MVVPVLVPRARRPCWAVSAALVLVALALPSPARATGFKAELLQRPVGMRLRPVGNSYVVRTGQCSALLSLRMPEMCGGARPLGFAVDSASGALTSELVVDAHWRDVILRRKPPCEGDAWLSVSVACAGRRANSAPPAPGPGQRLVVYALAPAPNPPLLKPSQL